MNAWEVNFDGLVGLTHHYAGLSFGNEASTRHRFQVSNPRQAAKQGLLKMKALADAGFPQAVIPPHERPFIPVFRYFGIREIQRRELEKVALAFQRQFRFANVGSQCGNDRAICRYAGWQSASHRCQPEQ